MSTVHKLDWKLSIPSWSVQQISGLEEIDPWLQQPGDAMVSLAHAREAREYARQWRNHRVGACATRLLDDSYIIGQYMGANKKLTSDDPADIHAEEPLLNHALADGSTTLSVIAVVGDVQPDDSSGADAPTLLPCARRCLPMILASSLVVDKTLILSATPDLRTVQFYSPLELSEVHRTGDASKLPTVHFETGDGLDQGEWAEKFIGPLLDRIVS